MLAAERAETLVTELVLARVFDRAQAQRVWLDVKPGNARARRCYSSLGFIEEGTLRSVNLARRSDLLILMSLHRLQWERPNSCCDGAAL